MAKRRYYCQKCGNRVIRLGYTDAHTYSAKTYMDKGTCTYHCWNCGTVTAVRTKQRG